MENYMDIKVKEMMAHSSIQEAIKNIVSVPKKIIIKSTRNPFKNEETGETTQKVHGVSGTSLTDMVEVDFTLVNQEIDGTSAINKEFEIIEYGFALEANMRGGNFNGYSPTGLKLLVTKIASAKIGGKQE